MRDVFHLKSENMKLSLRFTLSFVLIYCPGVFSTNNSRHTRTSNGQDAIIHSAPWIVSLLEKEAFHFCGGSLLNKDWILTSAQCISSKKPDQLEAIAGDHDIVWNDNTEQLRFVDKVKIHPEFAPNLNDIALVHVSISFDFNDFVKEIPLSPPDVCIGDATLFGWNFKERKIQTILQAITFTIIEHEECLKQMGTVLDNTEKNFCARFATSDNTVNREDSGSPLVQNDRLIGVLIKRETPCGTSANPCIFTHIGAYIDWINGSMN